MSKLTMLNRRSRLVLPIALLVFIFMTACTPIDTNATPIVMFPSKVPVGNLPTLGGPTSAVVNPSVPTQQVVVPTTQVPAFTFIAVTNAPTRIPPTPIPIQPTQFQPTRIPPTVIPTIDANWNSIATGIQWRTINFRDSRGQTVGVIVVRFEPSRVQFTVNYARGLQKSIREWQQLLPGAQAIVNANFYDTNFNAIGLVAVNNVSYGSSINRTDAGMFQIVNGEPRVRSLFLEPYRNTERFTYAVQGFPMLMVAGQVAPAFNPDLSKEADRRTIIAQDKQKRILFIVTQFSTVTFTDMAKFLGVSGLEIDYALNLDGGTSSNLYLATGGPSQFTAGLKGIPVTVAVYKR